MGKYKLWIAGLLSVIVLVGYGCRDQAIQPVNSGQETAGALQKLKGQAQGSSMMMAQDRHNFRAHLNGRGVVPSVDTRAQGEAIFHVSEDGMEISYKLNAANIENVFAAHIHVGAPDENGPVVVPLFSGPKMEGRFQGVLAEGTITASDLTGPLGGQSLESLMMEIEEGNAYVQAHTEQNPPGEIRGQIR